MAPSRHVKVRQSRNVTAFKGISVREFTDILSQWPRASDQYGDAFLITRAPTTEAFVHASRSPNTIRLTPTITITASRRLIMVVYDAAGNP